MTATTKASLRGTAGARDAAGGGENRDAVVVNIKNPLAKAIDPYADTLAVFGPQIGTNAAASRRWRKVKRAIPIVCVSVILIGVIVWILVRERPAKSSVYDEEPSTWQGSGGEVEDRSGKEYKVVSSGAGTFGIHAASHGPHGAVSDGGGTNVVMTSGETPSTHSNGHDSHDSPGHLGTLHETTHTASPHGASSAHHAGAGTSGDDVGGGSLSSASSQHAGGGGEHGGLFPEPKGRVESIPLHSQRHGGEDSGGADASDSVDGGRKGNGDASGDGDSDSSGGARMTATRAGPARMARQCAYTVVQGMHAASSEDEDVHMTLRQIVQDEDEELNDWCSLMLRSHRLQTRFDCHAHRAVLYLATRRHHEAPWGTAQDKCRAMGAHLVSIHSHEENFFVASFMHRQDFWLGLRYQGLPGDGEGWAWVDKSPLKWTGWAEGMPGANGLYREGPAGPQKCGASNYHASYKYEHHKAPLGEWDDAYCEDIQADARKLFVCKVRVEDFAAALDLAESDLDTGLVLKGRVEAAMRAEAKGDAEALKEIGEAEKQWDSEEDGDHRHRHRHHHHHHGSEDSEDKGAEEGGHKEGDKDGEGDGDQSSSSVAAVDHEIKKAEMREQQSRERREQWERERARAKAREAFRVSLEKDWWVGDEDPALKDAGPESSRRGGSRRRDADDDDDHDKKASSESSDDDGKADDNGDASDAGDGSGRGDEDGDGGKATEEDGGGRDTDGGASEDGGWGEEVDVSDSSEEDWDVEEDERRHGRHKHHHHHKSDEEEREGKDGEEVEDNAGEEVTGGGDEDSQDADKGGGDGENGGSGDGDSEQDDGAGDREGGDGAIDQGDGEGGGGGDGGKEDGDNGADDSINSDAGDTGGEGDEETRSDTDASEEQGDADASEERVDSQEEDGGGRVDVLVAASSDDLGVMGLEAFVEPSDELSAVE
eukprot:jgi/Mesvir1/15374/Mv06570-RA.1